MTGKVFGKLSAAGRLLNTEHFRNACLLLMLAAAVAANLYFSLQWWDNMIVDQHDFRQTQTAISTYYLVKDGLTLDYITPVLGYPWAIPLEFPGYQLTVAAVVKLTGMDLDQAGRLVSLVFFYLCFVPLFFLLRVAGMRRIHIAAVFTVILSSPFYLFWSRAFMIESMVLFFSLTAILFGVKALDDGGRAYLTGGVLCGILAALLKITTFAVYGSMLLLMVAAYWFSHGSGRFSTRVLGKYFLYGALLVGVPVLAAAAWTWHAEGVKALNPLADFLLSKNLVAWNFGTLEQKKSVDVWTRILKSYAAAILGSNLFYFLLPAAFLSRASRVLATFLLLSFLIGPAVFTNLYYVHDYYSYATAMPLLVLLGMAVVAFLKARKMWVIGLLLLLVIISVMHLKYQLFYVPAHRHAANHRITKYQWIKVLTEKDEVLLIYGLDWNPIVAYYSERKAIMDKDFRSLDDPDMQLAISGTGRKKISAMMVCYEKKNDNVFLKERIEYFDFFPYPVFSTYDCSVYGKKEKIWRMYRSK